jgi:ABC-type sugar transport system permease subunit
MMHGIRARHTLSRILLATLLCAPCGAQTVHEIKVEWYNPNGRWDIPLVCFEVMRRDPSILCKEFSPLRFKGGMSYQSGKVMAFATGAGPDVFNMWTDEIASYREQGFLLPLNEFIGHDGIRADGTPKTRPDGLPDRNGQIDDDEATWPYWKQLDPIVRKIGTRDGKVYSIPARRSDYGGIVYRRDLVTRLGIDETPPGDWKELHHRLRTMSHHAEVGGTSTTRRGLYVGRDVVNLYPWILASGGHLVEEGKTNPETGRTHWYPKEELRFTDPDTGSSLAHLPSQWRARLTSPDVLDAFDFLWSLFHAPWLRDPDTGEAIDLSESDVTAGRVQHGSGGATLTFDPEDVIRGVARTYTTADRSSFYRLFQHGEVVCGQHNVGTDDEASRLPARPDQIGYWPYPPRVPGEDAIVYSSTHWLGLSPALSGSDQLDKRRKAWTVASSIGSDLGKRMYIQYQAQQGMAVFMTPAHLKLAGLEEYIEEIPLHWRKSYRRALRNRRWAPFNPNWLQVARNDLGGIYSKMITDRTYDYRRALAQAETRANNYILASRPAPQMKRYRGIASGILAMFAIILGAGALVLLRALRRQAGDSATRRTTGRLVYRRWIPWILMLPALLSVALWAYYPLVRGTAMAFMDYRLMGEHSWVGLDNYINVILDHHFQQSVLATLKFVAISLAMTFVMPIILAILLHEVPRLKQTYRLAFFLPQVSSSLVITLFWKQLFDGSADGFVNRVIARIGRFTGHEMHAVDWLGDPFWAPICVVFPMLWAGVGMGSLIYLAALKTVPDDVYEAADLDGAGLWAKIRHVTLPALYPIIVINFVGAFIGTFHQMQNIFVMTGGHAGTRVLSLHIWYTAFADLQFGPATATAWVLGSLLIGFTVWQLRILKRVEFRTVQEH